MEPNVLIVDDTYANLVAMRSALRGLSLSLHEASSGADALSKLLRHDFALVLMDVRMPVMNGYETARTIRDIEEYQSIPIVFVTGNDTQQEVDSDFENSPHLYKPIERQEIHRVINELLF